MDEATRASGAAVRRKMMQLAAKPDGESASANVQPPTVPNRKKNGTYGGRRTPDLRIRTHKVMKADGQTSKPKTAKIKKPIMLRRVWDST